MAKKKRGGKKVHRRSKKSASKETGRKTKAKKFKDASLRFRVKNAFRRFVFFTVLFVVSLFLYSVFSGVFWSSLFGVLSIVSGAASLGLLISLLVLIFSKQ